MTVKYPRRQQLRRLRHAGARAFEAAFALGVAVMFAWMAMRSRIRGVAGGRVLSLDSAYALRLAGRSRVGAESEAEVRRALEPLTREGWHVETPLTGPAEAILITSFALGQGSAL